MGLLKMFGYGDTPFGRFADENRYALGAIGSGLASGTSLGRGLANAAANVPEARKMDFQRQTQTREEQQRKERINQTVTHLQKMAAGGDPYYTDLLSAVESGALSPGRGYEMALGRRYPTQLKQPESERRIGNLMERGMSRQQAENLVYGMTEITTDPTTQTPFLANKVDGSSRPINFPTVPTVDAPAPGQPQPSMAVEGGTLWDIVDQATGIAATGRAIGTNVFGQLPGAEVGSATVQARQDFDIAIRDLVRVLQNNPRFAEGERKAIEKEISIKPGAFTSDEALRAKMISVDRNLRRRLTEAERKANDPFLPADDRRHARSVVVAIRNFLPVMGVPEGGQASPARPSLEGVSPADIEAELRRRGRL